VFVKYATIYMILIDFRENDNILYYIAIHKTSSHVIFARGINQGFEMTAIHHLYINQDNGLGMYKVQTKDGKIMN
jgi:hypothetical protein